MSSSEIMVIEANKIGRDLQSTISPIVERATALAVIDSASCEVAGNMLVDIKSGRNFIREQFEESKSATDKAHKAVCALERKADDSLKTADQIIRTKVTAYHAELEKERKRLEEKMAEEARLQAAIEAEKEGDDCLSDEILDGKRYIPPVIAPIAMPKVRGVSMKKIWKYEIKDESKINRDFMIPDESAIRKVVIAMGKNAEQVVGGIVAYEETGVSVRGQ